MDIKFDINEVFRFSDGRTVFSGQVSNDTPFIKPQILELFVDDILRQSIQIEGEMIPNPRPRDGRRVLSTKEKIRLESSELVRHNCVLRKGK